jgi:hypothetical protein
VRLIKAFFVALPLLGTANAADLDLLEGGYRFQLTVEMESGAPIEAVEGVLFVSAAPLFKPQSDDDEILTLFERGLRFMERGRDSGPMFCFSAAKKTDGDVAVMADYAALVIAPIEDGKGKWFLPIAQWPDWLYGIELRQDEARVSLNGVGGERAWGFKAEQFQVVPDPELGLGECLSFALENHGI